MKVVYFSHGYTVHDRRILQALVERGLQTYHMQLAGRRGDGVVGPLPALVRRIEWRAKGWPLAAPVVAAGVRSVLREIRPDVVHAGPVQQAALLTAMSGYRPLATMSWGSDLLVRGRRGIGRLAAKYTLARSAVLLCDCDAVRQAAVSLGMPEDRIVVFPWGVDLSRFSPEGDASLRHKLGWDQDLVLISTRAWEPLLGVDLLLEGFIRAAEDEPRLRLLLLNDGSLSRQLRVRLEQSGMAGRVYLPGFVAQRDLPWFYRSADCYVTASHSDGSSVSLLESMACGLPAIASDIPGNLEWVEGGSTGWVFEDGQAGALAECIAAAAAAGADLKAMGAQARRIAQARANWEVNAERMLEAYRMAAEPRLSRQ